MHGFPGATAVSQLRVYDWPAADGLRGGSPHLHTVSAEGYVVLAGSGVLQTLSGEGYGEHPLAEGTVLWFTPGTVHRLVTNGDLEILVVMQNAGLPEAGDAVLTFPPEVLADPAAYARAAALPAADLEAGPRNEEVVAAAAMARRDLAIEGFLRLRDRVLADGPVALHELYAAAASLVAGRVAEWKQRWRAGALAQAEATGAQLEALAAGRCDHLAQSTVRRAESVPPPRRYGMCGRLQTWRPAG
ncbi:MAG TPA: cupin domain-containing protein [Micromonosporaceae bacterium]|nr:cupin domain-containing protein [Micromonosporaceae bacterium]